MIYPTALMLFAFLAAACVAALGVRTGAVVALVVGIGIAAAVPDLAAALPFLFLFALGAGAIGLVAGTMLRKRQYLAAAAIISPAPLLWMAVAVEGGLSANQDQARIDFVRKNDAVVRAVGSVRDVYPNTQCGSRHIFSVYGERKERQLIVVVDTPSSGATFTLACLYSLAPQKSVFCTDACPN